MPRKGAGIPTRITASFDRDTAALVDAWGRANGMRTQSEALRSLVAIALEQNPADRAFAAAYQQNLAELRAMGREVLIESAEAVAARIRK